MTRRSKPLSRFQANTDLSNQICTFRSQLTPQHQQVKVTEVMELPVCKLLCGKELWRIWSGPRWAQRRDSAGSSDLGMERRASPPVQCDKPMRSRHTDCATQC